MNSALAALFGAVGGGARSYGQNTIREEQQAAMEQQRMNELKQQEQARLKERQLVIDATEAERRRSREAGVNSLRMVDPNVQVPEGDFDPQVAMRLLLDKQTTARADAKMTSDREGKAQSNRARYGTLSASGRLPKGMEYNENEDYTTWNGILSQEDAQRAAQSGRQFTVDNRRDPAPSAGKDPVQTLTAELAVKLMQPKAGQLGLPDTPGLDPDEAYRVANRQAMAALGMSGGPAAPAQAARPAAPAGTNMMRGLSGQAPAQQPLSPEDAARAKADPKFRAWLASKGYRL
jgi:hypothetical protein